MVFRQNARMQVAGSEVEKERETAPEYRNTDEGRKRRNQIPLDGAEGCGVAPKALTEIPTSVDGGPAVGLVPQSFLADASQKTRRKRVCLALNGRVIADLGQRRLAFACAFGQ